MRQNSTARASILMLALFVLLTTSSSAQRPEHKRQQKAADAYAEYVWPAPPDEPRVKLERVLSGRSDVEAESRLRKILIGASPENPYDRLRKPYAVAFDNDGRILVTDWATAALIRFDRDGRRMDVLGTRGAVRLKQPLGLDVGADNTAYVADVGLKRVVALAPDGAVVAVYGQTGELSNPTDAAVSPDGGQLFVADSKAHQIVIFDLESGKRLSAFGRRGTADGEFNFPTSLAFGPEGALFVVDQINARIQMFAADGEYLDQFGGLGVGFGMFARPKDVAIDDSGLIWVTDNAFNNVQLFDSDFTLLTFVGEGGRGPGRFHGASGIAVRNGEIAVVDQLGRRLQLFRFLEPDTGGGLAVAPPDG